MYQNNQAPEPVYPTRYKEHGDLDVFSIFETIQGEGPYSGRPCVFVRLAGCNLKCKMCDTDYTSKRTMMETELVVETVKGIRPSGLVVLTGGEPLRQPIGDLIRELSDAEFQVQIETNGTVYRPEVLYHRMKTVVSPKTREIHERYGNHLFGPMNYKYVLEAGHVDPDDGLPTSVLGNPIRPARPPSKLEPHQIYISPADDGIHAYPGMPRRSKRDENTDAAVETCLKFGYTLSLQTHKIIGMP